MQATHHDRCPGNADVTASLGYRSPQSSAPQSSSSASQALLIGTVCRSEIPASSLRVIRITGQAQQVARTFAVTSSASVESSPPEIPTTICLLPVCSIRFFSPTACIIRISSQRFSPVCHSGRHKWCRIKISGPAPSHEYPDEMRSSHNHANRSQMTSFCAALRLSVVNPILCKCFLLQNDRTLQAHARFPQ